MIPVFERVAVRSATSMLRAKFVGAVENKIGEVVIERVLGYNAM
jgi:hypothetical protein